MLRLALIELILFCIPFTLYFTYRGIMSRIREETHGTFNEKPMQLLIIAGGMLTLAGLGVMALTSGQRGDTVYIPAHVENGELVRGRFVPADEAGDLARLDPKERAYPSRDETADNGGAPDTE